MAYYIKANKKVADFIGYSRTPLPDGNVTLWQEDARQFLKDTNILSFENLQKVATQIGAVVMTSEQMRDEQNGVTTTELPVATDARFVMDQMNEKESEDEAAIEEPEGDVGEKEETSTGHEEEAEEVDNGTEKEV